MPRALRMPSLVLGVPADADHPRRFTLGSDSAQVLKSGIVLDTIDRYDPVLAKLMTVVSHDQTGGKISLSIDRYDPEATTVDAPSDLASVPPIPDTPSTQSSEFTQLSSPPVQIPITVVKQLPQPFLSWQF